MTLEKQKRLLPDKRHLCYLLKPRTYLVALGFLAPMVGNAQTEKVNVSVKNNTFSEFFKQIESQTNYTFLFVHYLPLGQENQAQQDRCVALTNNTNAFYRAVIVSVFLTS